MKVSAIIPAAGSGQRFGEAKQYKKLGGRPVLFHALTPFMKCSKIDEVVIVVSDREIEHIKHQILSLSITKPIQVVSGGEKRQDSVKNGLNAISPTSTLVCIHDAVRPFVTEELIERSIVECHNYDGAIVGIQSVDTLKIAEKKLVKSTVNRDVVWLAQTPQTFKKQKLIDALVNAQSECLAGTDESALMEAMGFTITIVEGHPNNFKITTRDDWERAELLFGLKQNTAIGDENEV